MAFEYKFLDDIAIADSAFEVTADSWDELFAGATEALSSVMVDVKRLNGNVAHQVAFSADTVEELLYDWLSEVIYLKDSEGLLIKSSDVNIAAQPLWQASGTLHGDRLTANRPDLGQDVKAVTYHLFDVRQINNRFKARVILDI